MYVPKLLEKLEGTSYPILSLDWSPDSRTLALAGEGKIMLWDASSRQETARFQAHDADIWGLAWSPDGSSLASASLDGSVKVWQAASRQNTATFNTEAPAFCVSWSPDGKRLAAGTGIFPEPSRPETFSGKAQIWDMDTVQLVRELAVSSFIISTAWSPDGRTIAIGQWDGKITLWDGSAGTQPKTLIATTERSDVNGLAWSPDGRWLAAAQQDSTVRAWDPETGAVLKTFEGHKDGLRGIAWSPDGTRLAATGLDPGIRVWEVASGQALVCLTPGTLPMWSLAWSPDGNWLAAGNGVLEPEPHASSVFIYQMPK